MSSKQITQLIVELENNDNEILNQLIETNKQLTYKVAALEHSNQQLIDKVISIEASLQHIYYCLSLLGITCSVK
jgi:hypothetical protein